MPVLDALEVRSGQVDKWYQTMIHNVTNDPLKFGAWRIISGRLYKYVNQTYPELANSDP